MSAASTKYVGLAVAVYIFSAYSSGRLRDGEMHCPTTLSRFAAGQAAVIQHLIISHSSSTCQPGQEFLI